MPYKDKKKRAFIQHQWRSYQRGIVFKFTVDEWIAWWKMQLGPRWFSRRGTKANQYVMARIGDKGSYKPSNVICITMAQNTAAAHLGRKRPPQTIARMSGKNHWMNRRKST